MSSRFVNVEFGPPVEVAAIVKAFAVDTFEQKVNLSLGVYLTDEAKSWVLPVVRKVEKILADDEARDKEYLPAMGFEAFTKAATAMLLGRDSPALLENRAFGMQCLSGTGSLRVGAEFCVRILGSKIFYCSSPSWENHVGVFINAGFEEVRRYRYWSQSINGLDIQGMLEDLRSAPKNSVIILQSCAHNPTGCDPSPEQWQQIADVLLEKQLFPFLDSAYQGIASGDLENDSWVARYFVSKGLEFFCAQSFAKNFGLYGERVGNLVCVLNSSDYVVPVKSQLTILVRKMYSNPPLHGAWIVSYVLNNPELFQQWKKHIRIMSSRIGDMRKALRTALERLNAPGDWSHLTSQIGMFSYIGLNEKHVEHLLNKYHIYVNRSGRLGMCGVTPSNVDYVARAIKETLVFVK